MSLMLILILELCTASVQPSDALQFVLGRVGCFHPLKMQMNKLLITLNYQTNIKK